MAGAGGAKSKSNAMKVKLRLVPWHPTGHQNPPHLPWQQHPRSCPSSEKTTPLQQLVPNVHGNTDAPPILRVGGAVKVECGIVWHQHEDSARRYGKLAPMTRIVPLPLI